MKTASWIIIEKSTSKAVFETFEESTAKAITTAKYEAIPAQQYLASLNKKNS